MLCITDLWYIHLYWLEGRFKVDENAEPLHLYQRYMLNCDCVVRDRQRTKMERDILADLDHPFIVQLHYGLLYYCYYVLHSVYG